MTTRFVAPDQHQQDTAASTVQRVLQQAHDLGVTVAQRQIGQRRETTESLRDLVAHLAEKARAIVSAFLATLKDWFAGREEPPTEDEVDTFVVDLAEMTGQTEVVAAMEQSVLATGKAAGVTHMRWIANPGACDACIRLAQQGAIAIDDTFVGGVVCPPLHPRCRCHLALLPAKEDT